MLDRAARVYVAGHQGMVGRAVVDELRRSGFSNLLLAPRGDLDLRGQAAVDAFFREQRPEVVVFAAARVGGIQANQAFPAEFIAENLQLAVNAVTAARDHGVQRFLYLGSTCAYPAGAPQPLREDSLLSGPLEPSNEPYAIAKIAGVKLCEAFRRQYGVVYHSLMPTNLYGPGDRFHTDDSHVIPALLRRFHEAARRGASSVRIWGSGTALRDFLYVGDLARAVLCVLDCPDPPDVVNVGSGSEIRILDLARRIADLVGFGGEITTDSSRPVGVPRKLTDISRIRSLGWRPQVPLAEGLAITYQACVESLDQAVSGAGGPGQRAGGQTRLHNSSLRDGDA